VDISGVQFVQVLMVIAVALFSLLSIMALLLVARSEGRPAAIPLIAPRVPTRLAATAVLPPPAAVLAPSMPTRAPPLLLHRQSLTSLAYPRQ
jgi:hypothetical protein